MKFAPIALEDLLLELTNLPSEWMDDEARNLVASISVVLQQIRSAGPDIDQDQVAKLLSETPTALDILRLLTGHGQEPMAHRLYDELNGKRGSWSALRRRAKKEPKEPQAVAEEIYSVHDHAASSPLPITRPALIPNYTSCKGVERAKHASGLVGPRSLGP